MRKKLSLPAVLRLPVTTTSAFIIAWQSKKLKQQASVKRNWRKTKSKLAL